MNQEEDLLEHIDFCKSTMLNVKPEFNRIECVLKKSDEHHSYVESDCDEQLIINVGFLSSVKLSKVVLKVPDHEHRPTALKIFINRPSLDFGDAESAPAAQCFALPAPDADGLIELPVKIVKFIRCPSLQFFFGENDGEETTRVERLQLFGKAIHAADMNKLEKTG